MKTSRMIILDLSCYLLGVILLLATNTQHIPLVILVLPFVIFYVAFTLTVLLIMHYLDNSKVFIFNRKRLLSAGLIASLPIISLVLTSIGQFSYRSFITLLVIFGIAGFYINRSS